MNPTQNNVTAGGSAAANRIAEVRQNVNNGLTTPQARAVVRKLETPSFQSNNLPSANMPNYVGFGGNQSTGFSVTLPDTVPAESLNGNVGIQDVRGRRDALEQSNMATEQFNTDFDALIGRISSTETPINPLSDPNAFLNKFLLSRPTDTQDKLGSTYKGLQSATTDFAQDYDKTAVEARAQFGIPELQTALAETRTQIAEKTKLLREQLRDFETNAERRGVAREFVDSEKAKITAKANAELADLGIIELAQLGNVTEAKASVTELLDDKKQAFEFEEKSILNEIARLTQLNTQEAEKRADQLTVALAEKKTRDKKALADEAARLDYLTQAASEGADQGTLLAIRNAKSPQEAAFLASPFIGRIDRLQAEASMASDYASRRNSVIEAAKNGDPQAIKELGFDPNQSTPLGEYSNVIDTASLLVGAERGQETRRAMAAAIERGDYTTTYSQIANNVQSNLQGEAASRFGAARTDIQVLSGLRDTIEQFEAQGGDTGFLKGNADVIARKFGQLATDPKFASLAVQLEREFQAYRQQMTGAAFGAGESADYEKVNPSSTKSLELNLATIDGAIRQLENRVVGTVESYVPSSREIYDLATGNEKVINSSDPAKEPIGSVLEIGGTRYRKVGDDAYEPI